MFFRSRASLQIMSLLRRPRGQFAEAASRSGSLSCLILAGAAKRLTKCCLISISSAPPADRSAAHLQASCGSRAARALSALCTQRSNLVNCKNRGQSHQAGLRPLFFVVSLSDFVDCKIRPTEGFCPVGRFCHLAPYLFNRSFALFH